MDGAALLARIDALARISERPGMLVRRFLTEEHRRANELVGGWMREGGMAVRTDAIGNLIGRYEGTAPGLPCLMLGSHLDTVVDAGRYDGMLGVVTAIACVETLAAGGRRLPFAIEILGFADEEGARFGATLLGSRAVAGSFDRTVLDRIDDDGLSMAEALSRFGLDPAAIGQAARRRDEILAYVELHIEQGPVLERLGLAAGCVTAISGATRYEIEIEGEAGHAGTVPMAGRRDAVAAAAECILAIEAHCRAQPDLVGTVGIVESVSGAVNVVPGKARFTLDLRAPEDAPRREAQAQLLSRFAEIAERRRVEIRPVKTHEGRSAPAAPWLIAQIERALAAEGVEPHRLPSGAGHDGMAMIELTDIGMIFLRCAGGVSHNPAESVTAADAETGARVLLRFIENFQPQRVS
ncbi:MAG TPA: allantoate amidohydrolase [Aliidongia sp.]|nr:allantoate amidohydrolase [Aliidongia sp.]